MTGAFGFRAVARELVSRIPFGGGLIPKAAMAFAGTYVVGLSLERYHRVGYGLTREESRREHQQALVQGRSVAELLLLISAHRHRASAGSSACFSSAC